MDLDKWEGFSDDNECHFKSKKRRKKKIKKEMMMVNVLISILLSCRAGNAYSSGIRGYINAEVVSYWRLFFHCKVVWSSNIYWSCFFFFKFHTEVAWSGIWTYIWLDNMLLCSDGTFYLWETNTWTSERWSSSGGRVTVSENYELDAAYHLSE